MLGIAKLNEWTNSQSENQKFAFDLTNIIDALDQFFYFTVEVA